MSRIRSRYVFARPGAWPQQHNPLAETAMLDEVTQYGITGAFDQQYPVGQLVRRDR